MWIYCCNTSVFVLGKNDRFSQAGDSLKTFKLGVFIIVGYQCTTTKCLAVPLGM